MRLTEERKNREEYKGQIFTHYELVYEFDSLEEFNSDMSFYPVEFDATEHSIDGYYLETYFSSSKLNNVMFDLGKRGYMVMYMIHASEFRSLHLLKTISYFTVE